MAFLADQFMGWGMVTTNSILLVPLELNHFCYFLCVLLFYVLGKTKWSDTLFYFIERLELVMPIHQPAPKLICQKSHAVTPKCNNSYFANFKMTPNYDGWVNSYLILKEQREKRLTRTKNIISFWLQLYSIRLSSHLNDETFIDSKTASSKFAVKTFLNC